MADIDGSAPQGSSDGGQKNHIGKERSTTTTNCSFLGSRLVWSSPEKGDEGALCNTTGLCCQSMQTTRQVEQEMWPLGITYKEKKKKEEENHLSPLPVTIIIIIHPTVPSMTRIDGASYLEKKMKMNTNPSRRVPGSFLSHV